MYLKKGDEFMPTISFHNDTKKTSLAHNNRTNINGNKNIDIDKIKDNITYVKRDIREIYAEEFDDVVAEYNDKQKRADRKIDDYYNKVLHDKKTEHQRELIVAVGKAEDNTDEKMIELKKEILDQYAREFQKRNPNLRVYNCVMHLDEKNPHLHINYVPVASYSKGLKKRVAFTKALEQQDTNFEKWRETETSFIEELMNERGLEREYESTHKYLTVEEYKDLKEDINNLEQKRKALKTNIDEHIRIENKELSSIEVKEQMFSKNNLVIDKEELGKLIKERKNLIEETKFLEFQVVDLKLNIYDVEFENKKLKKELENIDIEREKLNLIKREKSVADNEINNKNKELEIEKTEKKLEQRRKDLERNFKSKSETLARMIDNQEKELRNNFNRSVKEKVDEKVENYTRMNKDLLEDNEKLKDKLSHKKIFDNIFNSTLKKIQSYSKELFFEIIEEISDKFKIYCEREKLSFEHFGAKVFYETKKERKGSILYENEYVTSFKVKNYSELEIDELSDDNSTMNIFLSSAFKNYQKGYNKAHQQYIKNREQESGYSL